MTEAKKVTTPEKAVMKRQLKGTVVSVGMKKTIVVKVARTKLHQKYQKRYKVSKKYKVHDEENKCHVGEIVEFVECRPLSKEKRWRVIYSQK